MIYASTNWFDNDLIDSELAEYPHWAAQWGSECTYPGTAMIWQYTSQGAVSGIDGNTDLDRLYLTVMYANEQ